MNILVTGGAGYIGSHTVRALQQAGYTPIIVDNLSRGHVESIPEGVTFYNMDIADPKLVDIMKDHHIIGVMHFAAHSQVGESMVNPSIYYENKVDPVTKYKIYAYVAIAGLLWSNWCEYKRLLGVDFGEYSLKQYRYAKVYYRIVQDEFLNHQKGEKHE